MLDKKDCLFERDEEGKLISRVVTLELLEDAPEIRLKPLTRGKLMSVFQKAKDGTEEEKKRTDTEIITNGLVEPIFTEKEIDDLKPNYASAIATAIIAASLGISQSKVKSSSDNVLQAETEIKK